MSALGSLATREALDAGGHICLVVDDDAAYEGVAASFLASGGQRGEKTVAFGPQCSPDRERLRPLAAVVADPYLDVLGGRGLEPATMFEMFAEQTRVAREEGYSRLRVAADMDWLLPAKAPDTDLIAFEVLLDRVVGELDATVMCAYRRSSFGPDTVLGTCCTHPVVLGEDDPPFRLVAGDGAAWRLSGEIDLACAQPLAAALRATARAPWILDLARLDFADVAGLRAIATTVARAGLPLDVRHASPTLRRSWEILRFDDLAPGVRFAD